MCLHWRILTDENGKVIWSEMLANFKECGLHCYKYWELLEVFEEKSDRIKFIFQNRTQNSVWRMSCTEISEETNKREISEQLRKGRTNLRFLKVFAFQFLTSNFLYVYLFILNSGVPVTAYPAFIFTY